MATTKKAKGSWWVRFFIGLLAVFSAVLFFWLLSFIESDIGRLKAPDWNQVRLQYAGEELVQRQDALKKSVAGLNRSIETLLERKKNVYQSVTNLQNTINQLLSIQRESINKNIEFPEESLRTLSESQSAFLNYQSEDLKYTRQISELTTRRQEEEQQLASVNEAIEQKEKAARQAYNRTMEKYRVKVAAIKLSVLLPIFVAMSFLFFKCRGGAYGPLVWAAFLASLAKIAFIAHQYFPTRYFKYIALLVVIGIVVRLLVGLIKMLVAPKKDLLIKQYQEHYDKCLCPVCSKPIRSGPLRFIDGLNKRTHLSIDSSADNAHQLPYTCPSCGTALYAKCEHCNTVRHLLLPYCEHCGHEKNIT